MSNKRDRFTEVYYELYPVVFGTVYTKVGNLDDVHDICQEVFVRLYDKLDEVKNLKKWVLGAVRLVTYEYYRAKKKGESVNIDDFGDDMGLTFVNGMRDTRMIIAQAMEAIDAELDETERALFELVAIMNYSYSEVAEQFGMTKRMVEYRYRSVVARIIDWLQKKGIKSIEDLL
jgi:RNA polymerase sigma factor (sigma-70 family)